MREQIATRTTTTQWLSAKQPGRTSTGTYAGIPDDASHSTAIVRNTPRHVQPYRRDVRVHIHNGLPPSHMRRASRPAPTTTQPGDEEEEPRQQRPRRRLAFQRFALGIAILICLCYLAYFLVGLFFAWIQSVSDQMHYGTPRTYQTDKDVGHGGISHFTVENLNGHIVVYELPNDDPSKALVYSGPTFSDANVPAIVTFKTDASTGKVTEMDIDVDNTVIPFPNGTDGKFHPQGQQGGS